MAVLVLFQFICVRIVLGFYENASVQSAAKTAPVPLTVNVQATTTKTGIGLPVRLKIQKIGVDAVIRSVGLTSNGSMGVPKLPLETAWYMYGPKPGEIGSAAIAGHINWWYGAKGVFAHLNNVKVGDLITVQDDRGVNTSFIVTKTHAYGQKEDATDVFHSYDGGSHLNLVTCSGVWDKALRMYSKRLVVFADKVIE